MDVGHRQGEGLSPRRIVVAARPSYCFRRGRSSTCFAPGDGERRGQHPRAAVLREEVDGAARGGGAAHARRRLRLRSDVSVAVAALHHHPRLRARHDRRARPHEPHAAARRLHRAGVHPHLERAPRQRRARLRRAHRHLVDAGDARRHLHLRRPVLPLHHAGGHRPRPRPHRAELRVRNRHRVAEPVEPPDLQRRRRPRRGGRPRQLHRAPAHIRAPRGAHHRQGEGRLLAALGHSLRQRQGELKRPRRLARVHHLVGAVVAVAHLPGPPPGALTAEGNREVHPPLRQPVAARVPRLQHEARRLTRRALAHARSPHPARLQAQRAGRHRRHHGGAHDGHAVQVQSAGRRAPLGVGLGARARRAWADAGEAHRGGGDGGHGDAVGGDGGGVAEAVEELDNKQTRRTIRKTTHQALFFSRGWRRCQGWLLPCLIRACPPATSALTPPSLLAVVSGNPVYAEKAKPFSHLEVERLGYVAAHLAARVGEEALLRVERSGRHLHREGAPRDHLAVQRHLHRVQSRLHPLRHPLGVRAALLHGHVHLRDEPTPTRHEEITAQGRAQHHGDDDERIVYHNIAFGAGRRFKRNACRAGSENTRKARFGPGWRRSRAGFLRVVRSAATHLVVHPRGRGDMHAQALLAGERAHVPGSARVHTHAAGGPARRLAAVADEAHQAVARRQRAVHRLHLTPALPHRLAVHQHLQVPARRI
eukprot:270356-Prorocentrum_minimum.AAC.3